MKYAHLSQYSYRVWRDGELFRSTCDEFPGVMATGISHDDALDKLSAAIAEALMANPFSTLPLFAEMEVSA